MIVCDELKCVFVHVPKTGGSTITEILAPYVNPDFSVEEERGWQVKFHKIHMHAGLTNPEQYKEYWRFALIRNPYDRWMSWTRNTPKPGRKLRQQSTLVKYVDTLFSFEHYETSLKTIAEKLNISLPTPLPHRLNTQDRVKPIDEETAEFVWKKFRGDFELGYQKESWKDYA